MAQQEGKHYRFRDGTSRLEFWAERGMISLVDEDLAADTASDKQSHWRIPPGEFIKRAISAMMAEPEKYPSKLRVLRQLLEDAKTACKLAKAQGDPTDPSTIDTVVRHQRKRQIVMPHELPPMPGMPRTPPSKIRPRGGSGGDILKAGVDVVPDLSLDGAGLKLPT